MSSNIPGCGWLSSAYDSFSSISVPEQMESVANHINESVSGQSPCDSTCVAVSNGILSGTAGISCAVKAYRLCKQGRIKAGVAFGCLSLLMLGYAVTTTALFTMSGKKPEQTKLPDPEQDIPPEQTRPPEQGPHIPDSMRYTLVNGHRLVPPQAYPPIECAEKHSNHSVERIAV